MDTNHRTASSFEHRFRKWRAKAREIKAANQGVVVEASKKAEVKGGKGKKIKDDIDDEIGGDSGEGLSKVLKPTKKVLGKGRDYKETAAKKRSAPETDSDSEPPTLRRTRTRHEAPKLSTPIEETGTKTRTMRSTKVKKEATPSGNSSEVDEDKDAEVAEGLIEGKPATTPKPKGKGKVKHEPVDDEADSGDNED